MKKKIFFFARILSVVLLLFTCPRHAWAQTVVYEENFGSPTANTLIQNYTGWQNTDVLYTGDGTCDIRSSNASNNYGFASGGGNVMINDTTKWFMISNLNTANDTNLSLYCGLRKTSTENGDNFIVEVSNDSISWTRLVLADTLPTGTGTSGWHRVRYPNVPSCNNLHIRFSNQAIVDYRLDDIALVVGEETVLETVARPFFSPASGTYYEPQSVTVTSATPDAVIYYTLDNTTPTTTSLSYSNPLQISQSTTIKAIAVKEGMYDSEVATANYIILDTNSLVVLPFDISSNSEVEHLDITQMSGFRGYHLGSSYANGSVKFESSHAGEASLVAHLDSAPGTVEFDLRGVKGGGTPSAYEGVTFMISQSTDGHNWSPLATIYGADISVDEFTHFTYVISNHNINYLRWSLETSLKGNTQLNNIKITKHDGSEDSTATPSYGFSTFCVFPNPASGYFQIHKGRIEVRSISLYNIYGELMRRWDNPVDNHDYPLTDLPTGLYILKADTPYGTVTKKIVKQ